MMSYQLEDKNGSEIEYYYSVRLLITHPNLSVNEITAALGMEPDNSWDAGKRNFTKEMRWSHTSWTTGKRLFFDEIHDVLSWLYKKLDFILRMRASGGELQLIVQLPGNINIGDTLKSDTLSIALNLGVIIGIEVFPSLSPPAWDN